jgi:hypothetical protein
VGISIATPAFNGARLLEHCVANEAGQAIKGLEQIAVEPGSTDHRVGFLRRLEKTHPALRWISAPARVQSDAVKEGVAWRAPHVGELNADDDCEIGVLRHVVALSVGSRDPDGLRVSGKPGGPILPQGIP